MKRKKPFVQRRRSPMEAELPPSQIPPVKIAPQKCWACGQLLEPGQPAMIHTENPIAWCLPCSEKVKEAYGEFVLRRAVVERDETNLSGDQEPPRDGGGTEEAPSSPAGP